MVRLTAADNPKERPSPYNHPRCNENYLQRLRVLRSIPFIEQLVDRRGIGRVFAAPFETQMRGSVLIDPPMPAFLRWEKHYLPRINKYRSLTSLLSFSLIHIYPKK